MRHRVITKHKEQQEAYLTNRGKARIAERRQANRKTQHSKKQTFENTHTKPTKKESAKNLADAPMPQADNPESTPPPKRRPPNTYNHRQPKETKEPPIKTDAKTKPKHDTEMDTSMSKTHWRKATMGHVTEQLFKRGWKWPKTPKGKKAKLKRPELQQIMIDLLGIN